ncbi:MAG: short-chain dehydrogenase [Gammaproteobacteria bacterium]|nr:short-chain dehydrogenase [Gammaproteobacteria bacterium]|tara:strand:+ start:107 stop:970 length:864 start_codon:yes stop_codon:yes gene_type:complete
MQNVEGKVAFITGGASGLGLAMARSFTNAGMKVVIADIQDDALEAVANEFSDSNASLITMQVNVTDRDAMEDAASRTVDEFGKVHVVCNNAGVAVSGNVADMTYQDWDWVMQVNLDGVVNGIVSFVNRIKEHGEGGHFVNTASIAGQFGMGGLSVYNATKFAVVGMSESMRQDLAGSNIGVSVLCPGFVATNIFSSERNRPDALGGPGASGFGAGLDVSEEQQATMQQATKQIMDPAAIGDMVLHSIQNDVFYILSHEQFKEPLALRAQEIARSFDHWSNWRQEHGV